MSEEEVFERLEGLTADYVTISQETLQGLLNLYKQAKDKIADYEKQLDLAYVEKNYIKRDVIKEKAKSYEWAMKGYVGDEASYGQSQCVGAYIALVKLLGDK